MQEICQKLLHMLRLFAAMPHYQRLALFLLTCTLPEADTRALKVWEVSLVSVIAVYSYERSRHMTALKL